MKQFSTKLLLPLFHNIYNKTQDCKTLHSTLEKTKFAKIIATAVGTKVSLPEINGYTTWALL